MTEAIWPCFSPKEIKLKKHNAERRKIRSFAIEICEASEVSIQKLVKGQGCFEWYRQYILSCEKSTTQQIPNETTVELGFKRNFGHPFLALKVNFSVILTVI